MEEIAWGQKVYHWSTPSLLQSFNGQSEVTLHRLHFFQVPFLESDYFRVSFLTLGFIGIGLWGGLGWLLGVGAQALQGVARDIGSFLPGELFIVACFFYSLMMFRMVDWRHQEVFELILSVGFALAALSNLIASRALATPSSGQGGS